MNKILYISTNKIWSGSEELWYHSACYFRKKGISVAVATKYNEIRFAQFAPAYLNYSTEIEQKSLTKRFLERLVPYKFPVINLLERFLISIRPNLVIISQGSTTDSVREMALCRRLDVKYVMVSQLVTELQYIGINNNFKDLLEGFLTAKKNFFVSRHNLQLSNFMLATTLDNAEVIYNPCKLSNEPELIFPKESSVYKIALVGRIECFHKGYDFLIQIVQKLKWKNRNVQFNIYGKGPHEDILNLHISNLGLNNINLRGYSDDVLSIWKENHILFMPSRMEGQALALIEAMWCKRAAIVTNVGGAAELIEEGYNGYIAEVATVESIESALDRAWENRQNWEKLGKQAAIKIKSEYPDDAVAYFNGKILEQLS
ncbi:glycosyltransferase family 4 protein [Pontibacter sp. H259]|uniref:glycosyltransferase family 4 protein n=1 Tax=Pontibacter sp. H259 TaxID=3133421 RepID=UPI0030C14FA4